MRLEIRPDGRILLKKQLVATLSSDNILTTIRGDSVQCSGMIDAMRQLAAYPVASWIVPASRSTSRWRVERPNHSHKIWCDCWPFRL